MSTQGPVIISGVTGQDGSYLADLLVGLGLRVVGLTRDPGLLFSENIGHLQGRMTLCYTPYSFQSILEIVERVRPAKIFNLAGQSYVIKSWEMLDETITASGTIPCYFLEAIVRTDPEIKFFQASSAEIYSPDDGQGLHEGSPILPRTPYGCAKAMAHHMVASYRENYGIFAVNGILFNHESPRRRANFLSRKIVREAVRIKRGLSQELRLGNLEIRRDWGYAPEYVDAMSRMLEMERSEDLIVASGVVHSVRHMADVVFSQLDLDYRDYVVSDETLFRPFEPPITRGISDRAREVLGWRPQVSFEEMMAILVEDELASVAAGHLHDAF